MAASSTFYDAREVAPAGATAARYANVTREQVTTGGLAVGVPGELLGLAALHADHGRLPWSVLVSIAVEIADTAMVTPQLADRLAAEEASGKVSASAGLATLYSTPDGSRLLRAGERLPLPSLAATLRAISADGTAALCGGTERGRPWRPMWLPLVVRCRRPT